MSTIYPSAIPFSIKKVQIGPSGYSLTCDQALFVFFWGGGGPRPRGGGGGGGLGKAEKKRFPLVCQTKREEGHLIAGYLLTSTYAPYSDQTQESRDEARAYTMVVLSGDVLLS